MGRIRNALLALLEEKAAPLKGASLIVSSAESGKAVSPAWSTDYLIKSALKTNSLVFAGEDFWGTNLSEPPLVVFRDGEPDYTHPLSQRFARPNPFYSQSELWRFVGYQLAHSEMGAFLLCVKDNGGTIAEVWPKASDEIRPVPSRDSFIGSWEVYEGATWRPLDPSILPVWLRLISPDPADKFKSFPPLLAAKREMRIDAEALRWLDFTLKNAGVLTALVGVEGADQETCQAMQAVLEAEATGAENAGKVHVAGAKVSVAELRMRFSDMDFGAVQDRVELAIARAFGVPAELLQILATAKQGEGLSGNAYREKKAIAYENKIIPLWKMVEEKVALTLAPLYDLSVEDIHFDLTGVEAMEVFETARVERVAKMRSEASLAERRRMLKLEDRDDPGIDDIPELALRNRLLAPPPTQLSGCAHETKAAPSETAAYAVRWDRKAVGYEQPFEDAALSVFAAEKARATASLSGFKSAEIDELERRALAAVDVEEWERAYRDLIAAAIADGADDVARELGIAFDYSANPYAVTAAVSRPRELSAHVSKTTQDLIHEIVAEGVNEGRTAQEIARSILDAEVGPWGTVTARQRAYRIARTETIGALNQGGYAGALQAQEELERGVLKEWVTAGDGNVRAAHSMAASEGPLPLDADFTSVGGPYPGGTGQASQDVNCRCVLVYSTE